MPDKSSPPNELSFQRLRVTIYGAVQGVGFRPFVYRLASELNLNGWVRNSNQGVSLEAEGTLPQLQEFLSRLSSEKPPTAFIQSLESSYLDAAGFQNFEILSSDEHGEKSALILPDIATCQQCLEEIFDPNNRRYLYPFTNCTNCGPRFSIIESLPYDRVHTTMNKFAMCDVCRAEYNDPRNRRFHAQPNACPECGPHLELWNETGRLLLKNHEALLKAARAIVDGQILAVKGLGGFHLMVDARSDAAVQRLRERKHREEKPFALMFPDLDSMKQACLVSPLEEQLLLSPAAPIVLAKRKAQSAERHSKFDIRYSIFDISQAVAPNNPYLGVMLPYTPLHHILMRELGFPVVATSGNLSDEPICIDEHDAIERLAGIADLFLVHNRPIARHVDDSIVRVMVGREMVLRRARGYAPLPIEINGGIPATSSFDFAQDEEPRLLHGARSRTMKSPDRKKEPTILAVGAHLKNTVAINKGQQVFLSQHIGDLETAEGYSAFEKVIQDFKRLYQLEPSAIACDAHPNYLSTQYAKSSQLHKVEVQHHYAHVLAGMAENDLQPPVLGISWDGTGFGPDGTIWGGEFLHVTEKGFERLAHLRTFRLPGGDAAVRKPRRVALGLLYEIFGDQLFSKMDLLPLQAFSSQELKVIQNMLHRNINSPRTSSAGRLFDAVASIVGLRQVTKFEGQAAMLLEFAIENLETDDSYSLPLSSILHPPSPIILDWAPMILEILQGMQSGLSAGIVSAKFHNALVEGMLAVASRTGEERVVLSGGCFQNKYLAERAIRRLRAAGFRPYWHQRVPPNDGGIALGQLVAVTGR